MKKMLAALAISLFALSAHADVIVAAFWDFGPDSSNYTEAVKINNTEGSPTLEVFTGDGYDADGYLGKSYTDAEGTAHSAGQALGWASGVNDGQYLILSINLAELYNPAIRWDYQASATGPSSANLEYKVGTDEWTLVESITVTNDATWRSYVNSLEGISSAINNQNDVQFRITDFTGGSSSGTFRLDNLEVSAIPEPGTILLTGLGLLGALMVRKLRN